MIELEVQARYEIGEKVVYSTGKQVSRWCTVEAIHIGIIGNTDLTTIKYDLREVTKTWVGQHDEEDIVNYEGLLMQSGLVQIMLAQRTQKTKLLFRGLSQLLNALQARIQVRLEEYTDA